MKKQMRGKQERRRNRMLCVLLTAVFTVILPAIFAIAVVTFKTEPALPGVVVGKQMSTTYCLLPSTPFSWCFEL